MAMKTISIKEPKEINCNMFEWDASYRCVAESDEVRLLSIESRSAIQVVVAKIEMQSFIGMTTDYYVSSPNFGVAIPGISSLMETHWITEKLLHAGLSAPDAVTIAQVLRDMGDF